MSMEMKDSKRWILVEALNNLIEDKEFEIEQIQARTEADYELKINVMEIVTKKPFCLEEAIQRDAERVRAKIREIEEVKAEVNDGKSRLLLVPNYIQLHLTGK
ncbi:hypothetical protein [Bacillus thuringiensis]|uniref:hypothetical protein n=1 Tax=Bacillus thuringiensis TaxID=1428 RepID=UPI000BFCC8B2|nr:hypothetical protein [Bacillus thuringiensis]PGT90004.1 hypothetical protein COD17_09650 [Bacillus thuringiensis]